MYLTRASALSICVAIALLLLRSAVAWLPAVGIAVFVVIAVLLLLDIVDLSRGRVTVERMIPERLSNGEENRLILKLASSYHRTVDINIIDESPEEFQIRDLDFSLTLSPGENREMFYSIVPTRRGRVAFGDVNVYVTGRFRTMERRFSLPKELTSQESDVWPSFLSIRHAQIKGVSNMSLLCGERERRKHGPGLVFDHIRKYEIGDPIRSVNWKATAKRRELMVNAFNEEQTRDIIQIIAKSHGMLHSFNGLSLLDYAINATLQLSEVCVHGNDNAGLMILGNGLERYVSPSHRPNQMALIMQALYNEKTENSECDFSDIITHTQRNIKKRSLLIIYMWFDGRQILSRAALKELLIVNKRHKVLIVLFADAEILNNARAKKEQDIDYARSILSEYVEEEKEQAAALLRKNGIGVIVSTPDNLTVDVINRYTEMRHEV
jgi:uncharacterized protein (DUF58 family)